MSLEHNKNSIQKDNIKNNTNVNLIYKLDKNNHKRNSYILIVLSVIVYFILFFISPESSEQEPCLFEKFTGFFAASCGITRASHSLAHFNFVQAFYYNRFFTVLFPFVFYAVLAYIINSLTQKKILPLPSKKSMSIIICIVLIAFFLYGVLMNLPQFEFLLPRKI